MTNYLSYQFEDDEIFMNTFDEAPLWSAAFGILMLKHLELKPNLTILDVGSGAGFPLMELAARCGNSCKLYGIDLWKNANRRANEKIKNYGLDNVSILEQSAENIPFENSSVDLIVSNLGINNFEHPDKVFKECSRVLKPGGRLALTTNLLGHWEKFYSIFYETLQQLGQGGLADKVKENEAHRGTVESITGLFEKNGFKVSRVFEDQLEMQFLDGTAFLNHHFIKLGWLAGWKNLFPAEELTRIFSALENNLNSYAMKTGSLKLSVPMLFIEGNRC